MALELIYECPFTELWVDTTKSLIFFKSLENEEEQSEESYKESLFHYAKAFEKHPYRYSLADNHLSTFVIEPELQKWVVEEIAPKTSSLEHSAVVLSKDIFQSVSVQQLIEDVGEEVGTVKYFGDLEEAQNWLFEAQGGWPY